MYVRQNLRRDGTSRTLDGPPLFASSFDLMSSRSRLLPLSLASGLADSELKKLQELAGQWRIVHRTDYLFRCGDEFRSIYSLRSGSFKTVGGHAEGHEHVTGYILPGELFGLGGICDARYDCDAVALEDSAVFAIRFSSLESLCRDLRRAQCNLVKLMSQEIVRECKHTVLLSSMNSERRVATFLINVSRRLKEHGYSDREFSLSMTRKEIGSFLGIKLETVSRTISRFNRDGLTRINGKAVVLIDVQALTDI